MGAVRWLEVWSECVFLRLSKTKRESFLKRAIVVFCTKVKQKICVVDDVVDTRVVYVAPWGAVCQNKGKLCNGKLIELKICSRETD